MSTVKEKQPGTARTTGFGAGAADAGRSTLSRKGAHGRVVDSVAGEDAALATSGNAGADKPGALRGSMTLSLHTRYAAQLWRGRKPEAGRPSIRSVPHFGTILKTMTRAAGADDPYADWFLLQLQEKLEQGRQKMQLLEQQVEAFIQDRVPAEVSMGHSVSERATEVEVHFESPLAYWMAYLVADYDRVVRRVQQGLHFGLLPRAQAEILMQQGAKIVRSLLSAVDGWKFTSVSRDDMAANNPRALKAIDVMGQCPEDVLRGELRSVFAPPIRRKSALSVESDSVLDIELDSAE